MKHSMCLLSILCFAAACDDASLPNSSPRHVSDSANLYEDYDPTPQPSKWPADAVEAGNTNTQTPEKVLEAVSLIESGKKYPLGHPYTADMPLFPGNVWEKQQVPSILVNPNQAFNTELLTTHIGQNGTQFDAFGHFGWAQVPLNPTEIIYHGGFTQDEVWSPEGLKKLGVEKLHPFFTRAILVDVARAKNTEVLDPGYEITKDDMLEALAAQSMSEHDITEGDVVLVRTGWDTHWNAGQGQYYQGAPGIPGGTPGIGLEVAQWLADKAVACVGSDNWAVEVAGEGDRREPPPGLDFPVHHELLVSRGIPLQESMRLADIARDLSLAYDQVSPGQKPKVYKFAYIYVPVPLAGGSGSPGVPMAVR